MYLQIHYNSLFYLIKTPISIITIKKTGILSFLNKKGSCDFLIYLKKKMLIIEIIKKTIK